MRLLFLLFSVALGACAELPGTTLPDGALASDSGGPESAVRTRDARAPADGSEPVEPEPPAAPGTWCALGVPAPELAVPAEFCARRFVQLRHPRSLAFAPDGALFVAAPRAFSPGGGGGGPGAVALLTDDDRNGVGELHLYVTSMRDDAGIARAPLDVQGLAYGGGHVYFTTATALWRAPYEPGWRSVDEARVTEFAKLEGPLRSDRWTHGLAYGVDGALYVSSAIEFGFLRGTEHPPRGAIARVHNGAVEVLATGFRNPMYVRCRDDDATCFATELGVDLEPDAVEKLVSLSNRGDYGYPGCMGPRLPNPYARSEGAYCTEVREPVATFRIDSTPFGFAWEPGRWPAPYTGALFVAMHGNFYSPRPFEGAGVVFAPTDPSTHAPTEPWKNFVDATRGPDRRHRPADVAFSADGRLFVADDHGNAVYWIAPRALLRSPR